MNDLPMVAPGGCSEAEIWLAIAGYEGSYEVSSLGRVRSLDRLATRIGRWGPGTILHRGRILKGLPDKAGYHRVNLYGNGKPVKRAVHQLVAEAFLGPCPPGQEVRHGTNGKLDNRASQLCYGTHFENMRDDRKRDGTCQEGEEVIGSKLTAEIVMECRYRCAGGETVTALAREFGVSIGMMGRAVSGRDWRSVPLVPQLGNGARSDGAGRICFPGCPCGRHRRRAA